MRSNGRGRPPTPAVPGTTERRSVGKRPPGQSLGVMGRLRAIEGLGKKQSREAEEEAARVRLAAATVVHEPEVLPAVMGPALASVTARPAGQPGEILRAVQAQYGEILRDRAVLRAVRTVLKDSENPKELREMFQAVAALVLADAPVGPRVNVKFVNRVGRSA